MTNLQLLLTIGIPSLLVVLSWMSNSTRMAAIEKRLDKIEADIERRFAEMHRKFDSIDRRFEAIDRKFENIDRKFENIDRKFDDIESRFDTVIDSQHRDALEILRNMTSLHERVAVVEAKAA